ncbi:MAG: hypothetical protein AAF196_12200 [Planctomycetota bacterium]
MEKAQNTETNLNKFVNRHLSQIKVLSRLLEHELETSKGREVAIDRDTIEAVLDTLEIFVEDLGGGRRDVRPAQEKQQTVTRLN